MTITTDLESALHDLLKAVVREVVTEEPPRQLRAVEQPEVSEGRILLRSHEVAEQLAMSQASLERLTRSGAIPCVRIGRLLRYSTESLREWVRQIELAEAPILVLGGLL